ncbi:MAG: polysaccharide deacetylase family protein [Lentisphaerae bacterium]|nr:polysaccharide deacetylase family protein [Lentisphaerota bacterium]
MDLAAFWAPYKGAVSLTFDDGTESQLQHAVPLLDKQDFRGTFYISPGGNDWEGRLRPWAEVARAGHEIGNHTLSHICSRNFQWQTGRGLEDMTLADIETDILLAQERLRHIVPQQKEWTFCYPCYQTHVGQGADQRSYVPIVARHFLAARAGGERGHGNHPGQVDLMCAWGMPAERMSHFEMIGLVEELCTQGRWVILVFHNLDSGYLSVSNSAFEALLKYLRRRADEIWTAPVRDIARRIATFQSAAK